MMEFMNFSPNVFFALKKIKAGEEITINYHGDPDVKDELWFDKTGQRIKRIKAKL